MKYKATIPGTENVLVGDEWVPFDDLKVGGTLTLTTQKWQKVTLYFSAGWQLEPIIELPTNKHAIVRIEGIDYWRGESQRHLYDWCDNDGGNWWSHERVARKWEQADNFDILFEGIAPEDTGL